jgi:hypothetical protein
VNGYAAPVPPSGHPDGDSPASGSARADGDTGAARPGPGQSAARLRAQASRLLADGSPEAALQAVSLYLQEADRVLAEAAHQFSDAGRTSSQVARDYAQLAADRGRLAREQDELERKRYALEKRTRELDRTLSSLALRKASLDALDGTLRDREEAQEMELAARREAAEINLAEQQGALDSREASLRAREAALAAHQEALESEKKARRRTETSPVPVFPDSGPLHLRPNPRAARTPPELMQCLAAFRVWSGNRSLRQISDLSGNRISASGVRNILSGGALPDRLDVIDAIVQGCGGGDDDRAAFASAWRRLYMGSSENTVVDIASPRREPE